MKFANKTETIKKETTTVKYGKYAGKKNKTTYEMGFARERGSNGKIRNRGILFRKTRFPSGKTSQSLLDDNILGRTKQDVIKKAKRMIKKYNW